MENGKLTSHTGEDLDAAFGWVDWRSSGQEVVGIVQSQLGDGWTIQKTNQTSWKTAMRPGSSNTCRH